MRDADRGRIVIGDSWHYRMYRFWTGHAEIKRPESGYRENLCHYLRVVLIWAPWWWFWTKEFGWWWLRPVVIAASLLSVSVIAFGLLRNAALTLQILGNIAFFLALLLGSCGVGLACLAIEHWLRRRYRRGDDPAPVRFAGLAWRRVIAAKHHICPLVDLPDDRSPSARRDA